MYIPLVIRRKSLLMLLIFALGATLISATATIPFAESIPLPDGFRPEGIAAGDGPTFYVGSLADGAIYRIDLITGQGTIVVAGQTGRVAVGLKYDSRSHLLFVAGGPTGKAFIYDADTGATIAEIQLSTAQPTFINDVVVTRDAAYFTDSARPVLYKVPLAPDGTPLATMIQEIPLVGEFEFVAGFNANGIDAVPNGSLLIIVNSTTGNLYTVDPVTGYATRIDDDLAEGSVVRGDGILLQGKTLYVVQNTLNQIAVIELSDNFTSGEIVNVITSPSFDVPTTIAAFGDALYVVNARFTTPPTPATSYNVVRVPEE
jgi:sugar lactone lactonase YvrE